MAEEAGQAETQPKGALNPSEAVAYISESLQESEKEAIAKDRDEKGKFVSKAETKTEPDKPEASEDVKEEAAKPEEEAEIQPEPRRFKLKYKGEEKEADEPEVIELAQKGYDYTQKSQALAKEREELAASVKAEKETALKQYEQQLEIHRQAVIKLVDQEAFQADLNKLALEDPAKAQQLFFKRLQITQTLQGIAAEQQRIAQSREAESQTAMQKKAHESLEIIQREIPGWNNDLYAKLLKTATDAGAAEKDANAITEPWMVKVLNEARQWREFQSAKPKTVDKRVAAVPKVTKPGTSEKVDTNTSKVKDSMAALSKTGTRGDAEDYVRALVEAGRLS